MLIIRYHIIWRRLFFSSQFYSQDYKSKGATSVDGWSVVGTNLKLPQFDDERQTDEFTLRGTSDRFNPLIRIVILESTLGCPGQGVCENSRITYSIRARLLENEGEGAGERGAKRERDKDRKIEREKERESKIERDKKVAEESPTVCSLLKLLVIVDSQISDFYSLFLTNDSSIDIISHSFVDTIRF